MKTPHPFRPAIAFDLSILALFALLIAWVMPIGMVRGDEVIIFDEPKQVEAPTKPRPGPGTPPASGQGGAPAAESAEKLPPAVPGQLEAIFNDDSALKLTVLDKSIELATPYGKLVIPFSDIQQVELAVRVTEEEAKRIAEAIGGLADEEYATRERAAAALEAMGEKANEQLVKVSKGDNAEAARRAKLLLEKLDATVSPERLASIGDDVVHTRQSRIAGKLSATTVRVSTVQFGELKVKLADLRELRSAEAIEREPADVLPDPGNLSSFQAQAGKTLNIRVTGATQMTGTLYGTGTYTIDSNLSVAAVHSGALKAGETKVVKVRIVGQAPGFTGSTQNGFSSSSYSAYQAYEVVVPKKRK